jgi:hypothetical protein
VEVSSAWSVEKHVKVIDLFTEIKFVMQSQCMLHRESMGVGEHCPVSMEMYMYDHDGRQVRSMTGILEDHPGLQEHRKS